MGLISRVSSRTYRKKKNMFVETAQHKNQVFEWDNTITQDDNYYNDSSEIVNDLPILNISDALKRFNTYEVTQAPKVETRSEKIARLREEISELANENCNNQDDEILDLSKDLEAALLAKKINQNNKTVSASHKSTENDLNMESRIFKLERSLGQDSLNSNDLFSQVGSLNKKLSLLEPANLQFLESKLNSVSNRLAQFPKYTPSDADLKRQIDLEKNVKKLTNEVPIIPVILNRLVSLQNIHEQVCRYMNEEKKSNNVVEELQNQLVEQKKAVETLQEHIINSSADMKNNLTVLEKRIQKFSIE